MSNYSESDLIRAEYAFIHDSYVDNEGIIRWKSNNACPMEDMLQMWLDETFIDQEEFDRNLQARNRKVEECIEQSKKQVRDRLLSEELYEMRATFGAGTTVVDVITGEKVQL